MKSIIMPQPVQLSEEIKTQLTEEVKETLAKDAIVLLSKKNFTAAEMWKSNRSRRSASAMMRKWNLN